MYYLNYYVIFIYILYEYLLNMKRFYKVNMYMINENKFIKLLKIKKSNQIIIL